MATTAKNTTTRPKPILPDGLNNPLCTGTCVYKLQDGEYVLDPTKSTCAGSATCPSCALTAPDALYGLVILLGKDYFPDPKNVQIGCGISLENVVKNATTAVKTRLTSMARKTTRTPAKRKSTPK